MELKHIKNMVSIKTIVPEGAYIIRGKIEYTNNKIPWSTVPKNLEVSYFTTQDTLIYSCLFY